MNKTWGVSRVKQVQKVQEVQTRTLHVEATADSELVIPGPFDLTLPAWEPLVFPPWDDPVDPAPGTSLPRERSGAIVGQRRPPGGLIRKRPQSRFTPDPDDPCAVIVILDPGPVTSPPLPPVRFPDVDAAPPLPDDPETQDTSQDGPLAVAQGRCQGRRQMYKKTIHRQPGRAEHLTFDHAVESLQIVKSIALSECERLRPGATVAGLWRNVQKGRVWTVILRFFLMAWLPLGGRGWVKIPQKLGQTIRGPLTYNAPAIFPNRLCCYAQNVCDNMQYHGSVK